MEGASCNPGTQLVFFIIIRKEKNAKVGLETSAFFSEECIHYVSGGQVY